MLSGLGASGSGDQHSHSSREPSNSQVQDRFRNIPLEAVAVVRECRRLECTVYQKEADKARDRCVALPFSCFSPIGRRIHSVRCRGEATLTSECREGLMIAFSMIGLALFKRIQSQLE